MSGSNLCCNKVDLFVESTVQCTFSAYNKNAGQSLVLGSNPLSICVPGPAGFTVFIYLIIGSP